jgi:hypothetical protein
MRISAGFLPVDTGIHDSTPRMPLFKLTQLLQPHTAPLI